MPKLSLIERLAVGLGLLKDVPPQWQGVGSAELKPSPPPDRWDDWVEIEPRGWPARKIERNYRLVPTTCFNCESACGLLAFVDKKTSTIRKFEGNPLHPASRGRLCAKGPATINQINDPDRILHPLKRSGQRGEGKWEKITWQEAVEPSRRACGALWKRIGATRSCITWGGPAVKGTLSGFFRLGAWTAITATPTSVRLGPASDTPSGTHTIGPAPTTRTLISSS